MLYLALRHDHRGFPRHCTCIVVLRYTLGCIAFSSTGLSPSLVGLSRLVRLTRCNPISRTLQPGSENRKWRIENGHLNVYLLSSTLYSPIRLGSSAFARRYSRNRYYFLFLGLLRCFNSAGTRTRSKRGNLRLSRLGFPIRKFPDQSLVGSSPKLIAASYVLHRQHVPRHPPHTLMLQEILLPNKTPEVGFS